MSETIQGQFTEQKQKFESIVHEYNRICDNITLRKREQEISQLTQKELNSCSTEETKVFRCVGKMFIKGDQGKILQSLRGSDTVFLEDIKKLEARKNILEKEILPKEENKLKQLFEEFKSEGNNNNQH